MTTLGKVLFGVGAAIIGTVIVAISDKKDYYDPNNAEEKKESKLKENWKKFKKAATKKVIEILNWAIANMDKIQAAVAMIGLVSGTFELACFAKKLYSHNKLLSELKEIKDRTYNRGWNDASNYYSASVPVACAKLGSSYAFINENGDEIAKFTKKEA
jgi:hypothetical protein